MNSDPSFYSRVSAGMLNKSVDAALSRCWPFDNVAHLNSDTKGRSSRRLPDEILWLPRIPRGSSNRVWSPTHIWFQVENFSRKFSATHGAVRVCAMRVSAINIKLIWINALPGTLLSAFIEYVITAFIIFSQRFSSEFYFSERGYYLFFFRKKNMKTKKNGHEIAGILACWNIMLNFSWHCTLKRIV